MSERVPSDLYFTVRGLRLHVAFWPGEGDPVLLLHATGFHARCWDEIIRRLPGRPVYAVDLPCHGLSEAVRPPPGWDGTSEMVADLVRLLDLAHRRGLKGCTVFRPNPVSGAILLDAPDPANACCGIEREAD